MESELIRADLKEVKKLSGEVELAVITFNYFHHDQILEAKQKLKDFITGYISNRSHNLYLQLEQDSVSTIITFDLERLPMFESRILRI